MSVVFLYILLNTIVMIYRILITFFSFSLLISPSLFAQDFDTSTELEIHTSKTSICIGESVELIASGAVYYQWNNGEGSGASVTFTPTSTTTYEVQGDDGNGNLSTAEITIIVHQLPEIEANSSIDNFSVCYGDDLMLYGSGANTYEWDNNISDNEIFQIYDSQTYTVTGIDIVGCKNTTSITIEVNELPVVSA